MPVVQENPSYFVDKVNGNRVFNHHHLDRGGSLKSTRNANNAAAHGPLRPPRRDVLPSDASSSATDMTELDVFHSSYESNDSAFHSLMHSPIKEDCVDSSSSYWKRNNGHYYGNVRPPPPENRKVGGAGGGLGQKIGALFKKSKSKHSLGSESQASTSTTDSNSKNHCPASPASRQTPDSVLSISTNSSRSVSSSISSTHSSNQISPPEASSSSMRVVNEKKKTNGEEEEDIAVHDYRFNDCDRYAANLYYNMGEYHLRMEHSSRPPSSGDKNNEEDRRAVFPTFRTFPTAGSRKYHSASTIPGDSSNATAAKIKKERFRSFTHSSPADNYEEDVIDIVQEDSNGYLRPNNGLQPRPRLARNKSTNSNAAYYINNPLCKRSMKLSPEGMELFE